MTYNYHPLPALCIPMLYRNHRGEVGLRNVMPQARPDGMPALWFGQTSWHPGPQFFVHALDLDRHELRDFALADVLAFGQEAVERVWARAPALIEPPPGVVVGGYEVPAGADAALRQAYAILGLFGPVDAGQAARIASDIHQVSQSRDLAAMSYGWAGIVRDTRRMVAWVRDRFGDASQDSLRERADRALEEALELQQAAYNADGGDLITGGQRALGLVRHVYSKPPGEPAQEIGGLVTCVLAVAARLKVRPDIAAQAELQRIEGLSREHFDRRHQAKVEAGVAEQHARPHERTEG